MENTGTGEWRGVCPKAPGGNVRARLLGMAGADNQGRGRTRPSGERWKQATATQPRWPRADTALHGQALGTEPRSDSGTGRRGASCA